MEITDLEIKNTSEVFTELVKLDWCQEDFKDDEYIYINVKVEEEITSNSITDENGRLYEIREAEITGVYLLTYEGELLEVSKSLEKIILNKI